MIDGRIYLSSQGSKTNANMWVKWPRVREKKLFWDSLIWKPNALNLTPMWETLKGATVKTGDMGRLLLMGKFGCKLESWNRYMRWFCLLCQNALLNRLCFIGMLPLFTIVKQKTHKFTLQSGLMTISIGNLQNCPNLPQMLFTAIQNTWWAKRVYSFNDTEVKLVSINLKVILRPPKH